VTATIPTPLGRRSLFLVCFFFAALPSFAQVNPAITSVTDPYTGGANLAPGGLALIQGTFLGQNPGVTVGGIKASTVTPPFASPSDTRMIIQIPATAPLGANNVVVNLSSGPIPAFPITLSAAAPILIAATSGNTFSPARASGLPVTANTPAAAGESITISAIGLGPAPVTPTVTLAGNAVSGATAALSPTLTGIYLVSFTVPSGTAPGNYPVSLSIGGAISNSITLNVGPSATAPAIASIVDAQISGTNLCPGDLATIWGINFGANPVITIAGKTAFIVTPPQNNQMTVEIPVDAPAGGTTVTITSGATTSIAFNITLTAVAPVVYGTPLHSSSGAPVTATNPALPNETIQITAIGLGATNPLVPTGTPPPANVIAAIEPTVEMPGAPILPGTAIAVQNQIGIFQISFTLPASPPTGNNVLLRIQTGPSGGVLTSNLLSIAIAQSLSAPTISDLENIYSYIQPGGPNYGIAQGSIFAIFGSNLSQGVSNGLQPTPLTTKLQQATVSVTVNGVTTQSLLYYASPTQLVAILPSATPVGDGTITVNNGFASASASIHVVQSAFGILTRNAAGTGPASAFDLNFQPLSFNNALNPGDYFILWGTGVGPVTGDESITQSPADLTNVAMTIEVGGVPAQLYYHGRSTFPGLDQVIGIVPSGVSPGCWVSVVTRSGNIVSNYATVPIAATGRTCADPDMGFSDSVIQTLTSKSTLNLGFLALQLAGTSSPHDGTVSTVISNNAGAQFLQVDATQFAAFTLGPSIGSCIVGNTYNATAPWGKLASTSLDAGSAINLTAPAGNAAIPYTANAASATGLTGAYYFPPDLIPFQGGAGAYAAVVGGATQSGNLPELISTAGGGNFTFDNGTGGAAIGQFSFTLPFLTNVVAFPPTLPFSNFSLSQGFTVNWSSADPNGFILITGHTANAQTVIVDFTCTVAAGAGSFTIPQSVLLSLPSDPAINANPAFTPGIQVSEYSLPRLFTAPGLDLGFAQTSVQFTTIAFYVP